MRGAQTTTAPVLLRFDDLDSAIQHLPALSDAEAVKLFEEALVHCRHTIQYDRLKEVMVILGEWVEQRETLSGANTLAYLDIYEFAFKNLNGRVIDRIPTIDIASLPPGSRVRRALASYFYLLTSNLEYDRARAEISNLNTALEPHLLYKLAKTLSRKPVRIEVSNDERQRLRDSIIGELRAGLAILRVPNEFCELVVSSIRDLSEVSLAEIFASIEGLLRSKLEPKAAWSVSSLLMALLPKVLQLHGPEAAVQVLTLTRSKMEADHIDDIEMRIAAFKADEQALLSRGSDRAEQKAYALLSSLAWDRNDFRVALGYVKRIPTNHFAIGRKLQYVDTIDRLDFLARTSDWLATIDQPSEPHGIVLLASLNCYNSLAMITPALMELKRRQFAVGSLMSGILSEKPPINADPALGALFNCIDRNREDGNIDLTWDIDWESRRVVCRGINYYQGIYERLSTIYRRATISIDEEPVASAFDSLLKRCDYVLRACMKVEAAALQTGAPVILLGSNSHVAPYSIIRDFCLSKRLPNLRYVTCNVAYENYYSNLGGKYSRSMAVVDMTLHKECRAPFLAIRSRFERWYSDFGRSEAVRDRFDHLLSADRSGRSIDPENETGNSILAARAQGRRVVCCFGKILCDLNVPYDGGPAHAGMVDWINHSIDVAARNPDLLLLIKPHPHELRPEIALELTEQLRDVCPQELPENVIYLGHRDFNIGDLAPMLDTAVLWNGTSSLELTGLGVPVVMCAHFGRHDYPLDLVYPSSRADYESLLTQPLPHPSEDLRWRAMALLHYMGTEDVAIPNEYSRRPITNDRIGIPSWDNERMADYVKNGDAYMGIVADRILEGLART